MDFFVLHTVQTVRILFAMLFIAACAGCNEPAFLRRTTVISGVAQKGPLTSGAVVTLQRLTENLEPSGDTYITETLNRQGYYEFSIRTATTVSQENGRLTAEGGREFWDIAVTGHFYSELTGAISASPVTLKAFVEDTQEPANINILTTLIRPRVYSLVRSANLSFQEAVAQAQREVLAVYHLDEVDFKFSEMTIGQSGRAHSILLALSAQSLVGMSGGELSAFLTDCALDLKDNGRIDDEGLAATILEQGRDLDLFAVRSNIFERYAELGLDLDIGFFEMYIDSDADGVINRDDEDFLYQ